MTGTVEANVGKLLTRAGMTLALAESCTGGLVGSRITDVPGSSSYFLGGVIAYHDNVKTALLGVPVEVIRQYGAVSAECALEMARGARRVTGADIGISVTGIAGPDGGSELKPVGTVFVALVADADERVRRFQWHGDRIVNKAQSAQAALEMLSEYLAGLVSTAREKVEQTGG